MTERWSQLPVLMESYFENSSSVVLSQIENAIKLELSHREVVADVLVYANDGVVTVILFLTSMDINVEREIYAGWMKHSPALQDKIAIQMVNLIDDAICKGDAISTPECSPKTVAEAFLRTAENFPEKTLTFHEANGDVKNITYRQLHQDATKVSMHLVNREESSAKTVVLVAGELSVYITAFWGCVLAGRSSLTVMLAPDYHGDDIHQNKLGQAISVLEPEFVLCCDEGAKRIGEAVEILASAELLNVSEQLRFTTQHILAPAPIEAVCPLFYQLTSGSTGEAKVIPITETAVLDQIYAVNQFCGYHSNHVSLNWLPFDHVIALLAAHIHDVYLGRQQVHLATPLVLADPLYWLRQLEHYRVSHCFAPNFAFQLVLEHLACTPEHGVSDLSQLEQIVSGGEAVSGKTVTRFIRQFESTGLRPNVIQPSYGMAEAAAGVTFERAWSPEESVMELQASDSGGELRTHVTSLGRILPGLLMRVVGQNQQLLKEREIGEIQLLGRKMCHEGNGWFGTGDLGFIDRQRLFVTGRLKDVIIVIGANFCSHQLESVVASVEGVRCGHVAVVGDRRQSEESVAVFYVPDDEEHVEHDDSYYLSQIAAIKGTLAKATGLAASAVLPLTEQQFPRTSIGKIKRVALQESLQADDYTARLKAIDGQLSDRMASGRRPARASELAMRLRNIWASVLNIDDLDESANFFELAGNSVLSAQLIGQINRQFDLNLDVIALFEAPSLELMQELVSGGLSVEQDKDTSSNTSSSKVASVVAGRETMRNDIAIIGMAGVFPGSVDPLEEIGALAAEFGVHFHADAAWGGAYTLSCNHLELVKGIEMADTVTICAHKQLYIPMGTSLCIFKSPGFASHSENNTAYQCKKVSYDLGRYTIEGSRPASILMLHALLNLWGDAGMGHVFDTTLSLTQNFNGKIKSSENFLLAQEPALNIVVYRYIPVALREKVLTKEKLTYAEIELINEINKKVQSQQFINGDSFVSSTTLVNGEEEVVVLGLYFVIRLHGETILMRC
ncbi:AMP-binding protein [Photobacterium rosenbergii]|uniref:AMP-binding protein n=1 Tax=Photobacterium rosenbergii TaxID=294936 RepID=A0ABU3ZQT3_9GAMM|nr:AMP-binding protein [Photobacterium rosenbergii]MDV5172422.1 AMP-binding protein [Photobacterium rosenbergii]